MPKKQTHTTNQLIFHKDVKTQITLNVRFENDDIWLTQPQIATLFDTRQQNISYHIKTIIKEGGLSKNPTNKKFLLVQQEGNRSVERQMMHYNMDMIITLSHRIKSPAAKQFRQWAIERGKQIVVEKKKKKIIVVSAKWANIKNIIKK